MENRHFGGRGRGGRAGQRGRGRDSRIEGRPEGSWRLRVGFRRLQEIKEKPPNEVLMTLKTPGNRLKEALNDDSHDSTMTELFLRCIAIALECESQPQGTIDLLSIVEGSLFLKLKLMQFIMEIISDPVSLYDKQQAIKDVIAIFIALAQKMPNSLSTIMGLFAALEMAIQVLEKNSILLDDLKNQFEMCTDLKNNIVQRKPEKPKRKPFNHDDDEEPPDNFREINVSPQTADVALESEKRVFIRTNKTTGRYRDLEHYLDVQFRLLREDFICPLREGIKEYNDLMFNTGNVKRLQDLRIYENVQILSPICDKSGLCYRICFDVDKLKRVRWESSKRLIFGSLVCLSRDRFKTMLFASVANKDLKQIRNGVLDLKFEHSYVEMDAVPRDARFVMAETTAYFEAYKHVLRGLQHMQQLPLERYIIDCQTDVRLPEYLRQNRSNTFDLRPLIDNDIVLQGEMRARRLGLPRHVEPMYNFSLQSSKGKNVQITNLHEWPTADQLQLDDSQYKAVQSALTNEFSITQGPPGTGKTYIGLKIVKALLHNYKVWNNPDHRPMLVVCYTNHALDQFLEGILDFYKGDVLRVGGRSTSEVLKNRSLNTYRMQMRKDREIQADIYRERRHAAWQLNVLKEEINKIATKIEMAERELIHEEYLQTYMSRFYNDLVNGFEAYVRMNNPNISTKKIRRSSAIVEWLGYGSLLHIQHGNADVQEEVIIADVNQMDEEREREEDEIELVDVHDEVDQMVEMRQLDDEFEEILGHDDEFELDIEQQMKRLDITQKIVALDVSNFEENDSFENEWQMDKKDKKRMKQKLRKELRSSERMSDTQVQHLLERGIDIWSLRVKDKWRLYRYWTHKFCKGNRALIRGKEAEYEAHAARLNEIHMQEDRTIMAMATVIGMTTTGAAKYQSVLQEIRPRIVVVEEAAEVLEAHVITTLSQGCQHLILIGDHKQLKPNPTVYKLAKDFNLEISLFERMVKNGMQFDCLQLQHRMRPEISQMMKIIYPDLQDHDVVKHYEPVKGISNNMYFIHHEYQESNDEEQRSHSNVYEARYIVALCRYLKLQGYNPDQITILTLYSGQLFQLRRLMPKQEFYGIRITVVDNFQGEENDIILLSLVRSNDEGKIGFLKIENRVCVALSRAKKGFYVIGNLNLMSNNSELWRRVIHYAKREKMYGEGLQLYCQNHPEEGILATEPEDFRKAPEGGCMRPCEFRLKCGHTCALVCHIIDANHKEYKCRKPCQKNICENKDHRCTRMCYQECGDCMVPVRKTLSCGHQQSVPCSTKPHQARCTSKCGFRLPCGHLCQNFCSDRHTEICREPVKIKFECGHRRQVLCNEKEKSVCTEPCQELLSCEHFCQGTCGGCVNGRLHQGCKSKCGRTLVCGHECPDKCSKCPTCKKDCENRCVHSRCSLKCGETCIPCVEKCAWICPHFKCTKRCFEPCDRPRCDVPCRRHLPCGHRCIGLCGEPCPRKCRICDREEVTEIFMGMEDEEDARFVELEDCGHVLEVTQLDRYIDEADNVNDETNESNGEDATIKLKECPKCKTPIRRNMRYGNKVRQSIMDIEEVKKKMIGDKRRIRRLKDELPMKCRTLAQENSSDGKTMRKIFDQLLEDATVEENTLAAILNQIEFVKKLNKIQKDWEKSIYNPDIKKMFQEHCLVDISKFKDWVLQIRRYFTDQELEDAESEYIRLVSFRQFLNYLQKILSRQVENEIKRDLSVAEKIFTSGKKLTKREQQFIKRLLETLKEKYSSGLGVTEEERVEIVRAMGEQKGHWFKCPNGHYYVIGDCGGATVESRCGECNATIGGAGHRLRSDNTLAGEVDGAGYAAWSEQANMLNYDIRF